MKKYQASNQNTAPPSAAARADSWAYVLEVMVSFALFVAMLAYLTAPAMIADHVFELFTLGMSVPKGAEDIVLTISQADAKELVWLCSYFVKLSGSIALYFIAYAVLTSLGWRNVRFLVNSMMLVSIASGDVLRSAARSIPLPEGAAAPKLFLSGSMDIPGVATAHFIEGMSHWVLAPFIFVGIAGVIMALYRIAKAQLDRKLESYRQGPKRHNGASAKSLR